MKSEICKILRNLSKTAYKIFMYIGVHQDGSLTYQVQIARYFKIPITTINYHITKFKQEGLIDKQLKLTDDGFKAFKFLWENVGKTKLRAHNIQVKFQVVKCPAKFPACFSKSIYQPLTNSRYRGIKTQLRGFTVMFYSHKKIVCVLPNICANNDEEISAAIQLLIKELKEILETEFEGIKIADHELAKIQMMHISVLNSVIAETYLIKGFTEESKEFAIDKSNGIPEIELTNPQTALRDIMSLLNLERLYKQDLL